MLCWKNKVNFLWIYFPHKVVKINENECEIYFVCWMVFLLFLLKKKSNNNVAIKRCFFSLSKPGREEKTKDSSAFCCRKSSYYRFQSKLFVALALNILGSTMAEKGPPNSFLVGKLCCFFLEYKFLVGNTNSSVFPRSAGRVV